MRNETQSFQGNIRRTFILYSVSPVIAIIFIAIIFIALRSTATSSLMQAL